MDRQELKYIITAMQPGYRILDTRSKKEYHVSGHLVDAFLADMSPALKGDDEAALRNLNKALEDTASEDRLILLDDGSGTSVAHAVRLLGQMGIPAERIDVLEGGYAGWLADDPYTAYSYLIDIAAEAEDNHFDASLFKANREGDNYISPEEMLALLDGKAMDGWYILDSRTRQEYDEGHMVTALCASTFANYGAPGFTSRAESIANIEAAFAQRPYRAGEKLVLICRGGKGGAQLLADVLHEVFGIEKACLYTLTYGHSVFPGSWMHLGENYTRHIIASTEPGTL